MLPDQSCEACEVVHTKSIDFLNLNSERYAVVLNVIYQGKLINKYVLNVCKHTLLNFEGFIRSKMCGTTKLLGF